jgi:hypothetical protein
VKLKCQASLSLVELGHGLGTFGHGVLGKLTWKDKTDGRLDVTGAHGGSLGDPAELSGLRRDLVESIRHKVVDNGHTFLGDTSLRMNLLEDLEDVTLEGFWSTSLHDGLSNCFCHSE